MIYEGPGTAGRGVEREDMKVMAGLRGRGLRARA